MDALQLAQVLADLSSLAEAQEAAAAKNLVNSNKRPEPISRATEPPPPPPPTSAPASHSDAHGMLAPPKRPASMVRSESSEGIGARTGSPYGLFHHRRMLTSPPMSRCSSTTPSIPGTPRREHEHDEHDKAATIMALYSLRAKLNNPDNAALNKARDKIAAIAERQRLQEQQGQSGQSGQSGQQQQSGQSGQQQQSGHQGQQQQHNNHQSHAQNIWAASRLGGEQISPRAGGGGD